MTRIVDLHAHFSDVYDLDDVRDVTGCVLSRTVGENRVVIGVSQRVGVTPALYLDPCDPDRASILESMHDGSALGYQHAERFCCSRALEFSEYWQAAEARRLPVLLHISQHGSKTVNIPNSVHWLERLLNVTSKLSVVVAHLGGECFREVAALARANEMVYFDISRCNETARRAGFRDTRALFSALMDWGLGSRLVFGSDSRLGQQASSLDAVLDCLRVVAPSSDFPSVLAATGTRLLREIRIVPRVKEDCLRA